MTYLSTAYLPTRIVGGVEVGSPAAYPFFVSWNGSCGASLVSPNVVLSAAHCAGIGNTVTINAYELGNSNTPGAFDATVVETVIHPQYDGGSLANDFMLLKLSQDVTSVSPIPLNFDTNVPSNGQDLKVIGLGTTSSGGSQPDTLREVVVDTVSDSQCNSDYGDEAIVDDVMLCAASPGKDSCQGDSGGPLFTLKPNGDFDKQVGVVSWGFGCADPNYPGVYSEISGVASWMQSEICRLSNANSQPDFCGPSGLSPPSPSPAPPSPGPVECGDSDGSFTVGLGVGDQDCSWLMANTGRFGHLCRLLSVASICPSTCDACGYFS